jgi:hypothetical protein
MYGQLYILVDEAVYTPVRRSIRVPYRSVLAPPEASVLSTALTL